MDDVKRAVRVALFDDAGDVDFSGAYRRKRALVSMHRLNRPEEGKKTYLARSSRCSRYALPAR